LKWPSDEVSSRFAQTILRSVQLENERGGDGLHHRLKVDAGEGDCPSVRQGLVFVACVAVFASQKEPFRQDPEEVEAGFHTASDKPTVRSKGWSLASSSREASDIEHGRP